LDAASFSTTHSCHRPSVACCPSARDFTRITSFLPSNRRGSTMPSSLAPQQHARFITSQRSRNAFLAARPSMRGVRVSTMCQSAVASAVELQVRPANGLQEHQQVANLRAEAYYEVGAWLRRPAGRAFGAAALNGARQVSQEERSRFVGSFKKKFAAQEVESLEERTRALPSGAPLCECLVSAGRGDGTGNGAWLGGTAWHRSPGDSVAGGEDQGAGQRIPPVQTPSVQLGSILHGGRHASIPMSVD
jgi:hypothetical protein